MQGSYKMYLIGIFIFAIAAIIGFYFGIYYIRRSNFAYVRRPVTRGVIQRNGMGGKFFQNGFGYRTNSLSGQIENISGNQITINLVNGTTRTITLSNSTKYTKIDSTDKSSLKQGQLITISGQVANGSISAQNIRINSM